MIGIVQVFFTLLLDLIVIYLFCLGTGTNRFATIVLYLSDVDDGGETFFPEATEWFDRNHDEYLQRDTCNEKYPQGKEGKGSCMYPSLTPTGGRIIKQSSMSTEEVEASTTAYLESKNISHLFPQKRFFLFLIPFRFC